MSEKTIAIVDWQHGRVVLHEGNRVLSMDIAAFEAYIRERLAEQVSQAGPTREVAT